MSQIGAELTQMQALQRTFEKNANETANLMGSIRSQLDGTDWKGPAADRFRNAWKGEFEPALKKLQDALTEAGQEVKRRHDALQQAGT
jgi:WXG100 family type VII secretion target